MENPIPRMNQTKMRAPWMSIPTVHRNAIQRSVFCPTGFCSADGTHIPGAIEPQQVPQMITITVKGAVNVDNVDWYEEIFNGQRQNPNGALGQRIC